MSWSSGKDSAWTLRILRLDPDVEVVGLLTNFDTAAGRAVDVADHCGENGEFHTFVHASPDFSERIAVGIGDSVEREGFVYSDIVPV